jgi:hypothetical protein
MSSGDDIVVGNAHEIFTCDPWQPGAVTPKLSV